MPYKVNPDDAAFFIRIGIPKFALFRGPRSSQKEEMSQSTRGLEVLKKSLRVHSHVPDYENHNETDQRTDGDVAKLDLPTYSPIIHPRQQNPVVV